MEKITEKDCLCEGLTTSVFIKDGVPLSHNLKAVTICPGPNLAYFSGIFSLQDMVSHIYGRINLLNQRYRKNMFLNEIQIYIDYLTNSIESSLSTLNQKQNKYYQTFKANLLEGIDYYQRLVPHLQKETEQYRERMKEELNEFRQMIADLVVPLPIEAV